jgi:hypothetical protein
MVCLTDEGQIGANQADEKGEAARSIAGSISWINEVDKDIGSIAMRSHVDQRDENSEETKSVNDENETVTCQLKLHDLSGLSALLTLQSLAIISSQEYLQR